MSTASFVECVVIYDETNDRVKDALILATPVVDPAQPAPAEPASYYTNEDGIFHVPVSDKPLTIDIRHPNITAKPVVWTPEGTRKLFYVYRVDQNKIPGRVFFGALIFTLGVLIALYLCLHYNVKQAGGPLSNILIQKIIGTQSQYTVIRDTEKDFIRQIESIGKKRVFPVDSTASLVKLINRGEVDKVNAFLKLQKVPADHLLKVALDTAILIGKDLQGKQAKRLALVTDIDTSILNLLRQNHDLMQVDKDTILAISPRIKQAMVKNDTLLIKKETEALLHSVTAPPWPGFVPWRQEPWRFFEILLWALAGVLVHKIISTGVYLWKNTFQNRGIWMHVAHIFVVPLLVLVTMMLLSMVSFEFSDTSGNGVVIDIADPGITRAFSFILAVAPWGVWDFVRSQSARITSRREDG